MLMVRACFVLIFLMVFCTPYAFASEQPLFGPVKYEVKERYGKPNVYSATFSASDDVFLIKLQNGEQPAEKVDWLEMSVNGDKVVLDDKYHYRFIACFVKLRKENTIEIVIKDDRPSGFRRPPPIPKNVIVTVLSAPKEMRSFHGALGFVVWEDLKAQAETILKIKNPAAEALALEGLDLGRDVLSRADAVRKLSDIKEKNALNYFSGIYADYLTHTTVRAEAALAMGILGEKSSIPILMLGILDPDDIISTASARALSFYSEEDTQDALMKTLEQLDNLRRGATIRTIANAGWKPVGTLIKLADSGDTHVAAIALSLLGGINDDRSIDYLLKLLENPGKRDVRFVIIALGETKSSRAADALMAIASNPEKRAGKEVDLADALANIGDRRVESVIVEMIKKESNPAVEYRLRSAYRKLTGMDYK